MYITSSGGKQHSTCLAVVTLLSQESSTCIAPKCLCSCECFGGSKDIPEEVILILPGHLSAHEASKGRAAQTPAAPAVSDVCCWAGTSQQPTNSLGSHLSCRANLSWEGAGSSRQSCPSEQAKMSVWNHLSGMEESGKSLLAYPLLWGTLKRRTTWIKYQIPQSIPHIDCATNGDEHTAKYFYISLKYRTMVELKYQHSSGSKKSSTA